MSRRIGGFPGGKPVYELVLYQDLLDLGLKPEREYRFHPTRKWRFDLALVEHRLAIEVEGFGTGGRMGYHTSPAGFSGDCEKYNQATILGWRLLRYTTRMVMRRAPVRDICTLLGLPLPHPELYE